MNLLSLDIRMLRSLISVVDTGSITETARRLGRTQPAISLQIQRLEQIIGKALFRTENRRMLLTPEGEMVLTYARSILRLHDELLARLSTPEVHGYVVLGLPDLYAASMLPSVLSVFRQTFPGIQIEVRCASSGCTIERLRRGEIDLALVTRMNDFTQGVVVHQEQLVWMGSEHAKAHFEDPIPLALFPPGDIHREYAIERLERSGRKWQAACTSESISGLQAAVFAGMAITALGRCALVPGMRELTPDEDLPPLPKVDLLLCKAPGVTSPAAEALHEYLAFYVGRSAPEEQSSGPEEQSKVPSLRLVMAPRTQVESDPVA
jgi:DNA-binding transcriptional LysR family regulator